MTKSRQTSHFRRLNWNRITAEYWKNNDVLQDYSDPADRRFDRAAASSVPQPEKPTGVGGGQDDDVTVAETTVGIAFSSVREPGETSIIGDHVKLYHGVTLGAKSTSPVEQLHGKKTASDD
jgi:hypothetical protein